MAFDQSTRNRLQRFVSDARRVLTAEFTRQLQNDYGLDPVSGLVTDIEKLTKLDDARRETARILRERIKHFLSNTPATSKSDTDATLEALDRIVREQAFTILNRLAALRMAEARGFLMESLANGFTSKGFELYRRLARRGLGETGDAYRAYLFSIFDEFSLDLRVLFDRFSPFGLLFPRETVLLELLKLINDPEIAPLWAEDETIGWIYQYFNSKEERKKMRDESAAPRNSRELAVRNQFFTPRYVVEFLTDNTLGRIWYEMTKGETELKDQCRYLVRRPTEIFLTDGEAAPINRSERSDQSDLSDLPDQTDQVADENLSQEELLKQPVYIPHRRLKDPREIRVLDPACGSMHFGLYAFDLLETIYREAWQLIQTNGPEIFSPSRELKPLRDCYPDEPAFLRDVPRLIIEHNLHGIDIDPRAVQIAGLSLWQRAQRSWQQQKIKPSERPQIRRSNIVCAEPMPGEAAFLQEFIDKQLSETPEKRLIGKLVNHVFESMKLAGEAGSLLKIEEEIAVEIAKAKAQWLKGPEMVQMGLFSDAVKPVQQNMNFDLAEITDEKFWEQIEEQIYAALQAYADEVEELQDGGYQRRLFAEDAARGFAFIDVCRKRYDVVLMNPPFGDLVVFAASYLDSIYLRCKSDYYSAFIECGINFLSTRGCLGAITNRTGFFLDGLAEWRAALYGAEAQLTLFCDLGLGVLDALVETAAYVINDCQNSNDSIDSILTNCICFPMLDVVLEQREFDLEQRIRQLAIKDSSVKEVHLISTQKLLNVPNNPLAYRAPTYFIDAFNRYPRLESGSRKVRVTNPKGDDFRFLRVRWEVPPSQIGQNIRWAYLSKGGEYSNFYGDIYLLIDWDNTKQTYRGFTGTVHRPLTRPASCDYFFKKGLTFSRRTASRFSLRVLPMGCIFTDQGPVIFSDNESDMWQMLAILTSRVFQGFLEMYLGSGDATSSGAAARHYEAGVIRNVPVPPIPTNLESMLEKNCIELFKAFREPIKYEETSSIFIVSFKTWDKFTISRYALEVHIAKCEHIEKELYQTWKLEQIVFQSYNIPTDALGYLDTLFGPHPLSYPPASGEIGDQIEELVSNTVPELIKEAIVSGLSGRFITIKSYVADRQTEVIAHILGVSASNILDVKKKAGPTSDDLANCAKDLISYIFGLPFGRWDIRFATGEKPAPELPDPFAPLPACPPGMLQNSQGLPAEPADVPDSYPLRISWPGILVDDPGHPEDIEARLSEVLKVIWQERADAIEQEACEILAVESLREYFGKPAKFFAEHLQRYSKSRRQAPIYWPLSTTSGSYTLWIYYHRLTDQTLYTCINNFVEPKIEQINRTVTDLRNKSNRSRDEEGRYEQMRELEQELTIFRDELLRLAKLPWKPNLNDGVQITAAPLWKLFRLPKWQKTLKETWDKLAKGEYDWAHLAYTLWPERVREKCLKDKSLAIAHNLEELYQEPAATPATKKKRARKSTATETIETKKFDAMSEE